MTDEELFALVKMNLRVMNDTFDDEIKSLIAEAESDISESTNSAFDLSRRMECRAVVTYCRAKFGEGDPRAEELYRNQLSKLGIQS